MNFCEYFALENLYLTKFFEAFLKMSDHYTLIKSQLKTKRQKLSHEIIKISKILSEKSSTPIFRLNTDCCDEMFEYLCLEDLNLFGKSCKIMQKVSGEYILRFWNLSVEFLYQNETFLKLPSSYCDQFISSVNVNNESNNVVYFSDFQTLFDYNRIQMSEFSSLNKIYLEDIMLDVTPFQEILPQIETVRILRCKCMSTEFDFYDDFLQYCKNLNKLIIIADDGNNDGIIRPGENRWLQQIYPSLDTVYLSPLIAFKIDDFGLFLEKNPTIQKFATNSGMIWMNRDKLLQSKAKLKFLEFCDYGHSMDDQMCKLLNQLYQQGFYERLEMNIKENIQENIELTHSIEALDSITLPNLDVDFNIDCLKNEKKIQKITISNRLKRCIPPGLINLVNVKELTLEYSNFDILCTLIRQMKSLMRIEIIDFEGKLNLFKLNKEREKLTDAKKVTILVSDVVFLETKWSTKNGNIILNLVEIRRG